MIMCARHDLTLSRYIQLHEPKYQVQPPRPSRRPTPYTLPANTHGSTRDGEGSLWLRFVPPRNGTLELHGCSTPGSSDAPRLVVSTGPAIGSLTGLAARRGGPCTLRFDGQEGVATPVVIRSLAGSVVID